MSLLELSCKQNFHIFWVFLGIIACQHSFGQKVDTLAASKWMTRASVLFEKSDFDSALFFYKKASGKFLEHKIWSRYAESMIGQGDSYYDLGSYQQAISAHQKAISRTPNNFTGYSSIIGKAYNHMGFCYSRLGEHSTAHEFSQKALKLQLLDLGPEHLATAETFNCIGYFFAQQGEVDSALYYHKKELNILLKLLEENDPKVANAFLNLGYDYGKKGDYERQNFYYEKALPINLKNYGEVHPVTATNYNNLGVSYGRLGDLHKKERYFRKSLAIKSKLYGDDHPNVAVILHNLSILIDTKGDLAQSMEFDKRALRIYIKYFGELHPKVALSYRHMGWLSLQMGATTEAITYLKLSQEIYTKLYGPQYAQLSKGFLYLASCYQKLGDHEQHEASLFAALGIALKSYGARHPYLAGIYKNIGGMYFWRQEWDLALQNLQKAIFALTPSFSQSNPLTNPDLSEILFRPMYLDILVRKAQALEKKYILQKDTAYLEASNRTYQLGVEIADLLRFNVRSDLSKQNITEMAIPLYENIIRSSIANFRYTKNEKFFDQALAYSEKSKGFLLRQALQDDKARAYAHIPDSLVALDRKMKVDLAFYTQQLNKFILKKDSINIEKFRQYQFDQQERYAVFIKQLEKDYPRYYSLKYDLKITSKDEIRNNLIKDQLFLEFFVGRTNVFAFAISKDHYKIFSIPKPDTFDQKIIDFRKSTSNYQFIADSVSLADQTYAASAFFLYNLLLKDILAAFNGSINNIILVPDGELNLINFESLLTSKPDTTVTLNYKKLSYLVNNYTISLAHSASILHQSQIPDQEPDKLYAGFAPTYASDRSFDENTTHTYNMSDLATVENLRGTIVEVMEASKVFNGSNFVNSMATESKFKEVSGDFKLLHLAMHGIVDENSNDIKLMFSKTDDKKNDGLLHLAEIYNLDLNADMVILSACNSGFGQIQRGEGVLSLSRAFMYSGSRSVIMSLWALPDQVAASLITSFSRNLLDGVHKDKALRQAKIEHIKNASDKFYAHPYFWAGLVPIGDKSKIEFDQRRYQHVRVGIFLLLVIAIILLVFRRRLNLA